MAERKKEGTGSGRRWVKIWHEILLDPCFQELSLEQQARYYNLLVFISVHGKQGSLVINFPARQLVFTLQCSDFKHVKECILGLPNIKIKEGKSNEQFTVTINKWHKYQVDDSTERVRRHRQNVTVQEKEKEEEKDKEQEEDKEKDRRDPAFENFWKAYPKRNGKKVGKAKTLKKWQGLDAEQKAEALHAVFFYADSKTAREGYAKDPERFLGPKDDPYWLNWMEPEVKDKGVNKPTSDKYRDIPHVE